MMAGYSHSAWYDYAMDQETRQLLTEIKALVKDNHDMLRAMRRAQVWSFVIQLIFWGVIIVGPILFLLPYLGAFTSITPADLQKVFEAYTTGQY